MHLGQHPAARWAGAGTDPPSPRAGSRWDGSGTGCRWPWLRRRRGPSAALAIAWRCLQSKAWAQRAALCRRPTRARYRIRRGSLSRRRSPGLVATRHVGSLGRAAPARWHGEPSWLSLGSRSVPGCHHRPIKPQHPAGCSRLGRLAKTLAALSLPTLPRLSPGKPRFSGCSRGPRLPSDDPAAAAAAPSRQGSPGVLPCRAAEPPLPPSPRGRVPAPRATAHEAALPSCTAPAAISGCWHRRRLR